MAKRLITFIQGFCMGITEIIPGVSGSSLAVIMGIYDDYIHLIASIFKFIKVLLSSIFIKSARKSIKESYQAIDKLWGAVLILGMISAIALFSNLILFLLERFPQYIFAFLFGLIVASIFIPLSQIRKRGLKEILFFLGTFIIFFIILGEKSLTAPENPSSLHIFVAGLAVAPAMLLPGISGSFVLFLLGLYEQIVSIVRDLTHLKLSMDGLIKLAAFGSGLTVSVALSSALIRFLFRKYESIILAIIAGLLAASLRKLFPFNYVDSIKINLEFFLIIFFVLLGIGLIILTIRSTGKEIEKVDE